MNEEYSNQDNHQIKKKKKKWIIITISIIVLILLGFLCWIYLISPGLEQIYNQGIKDVIQFQTDNSLVYHFDGSGQLRGELLTNICNSFSGGQ